MEFKSGAQLLELCNQYFQPISKIMRQREIMLANSAESLIDSRMKKVLEIMSNGVEEGLRTPARTNGGLIGDVAEALSARATAGKNVCGTTLQRAVTYAMSIMEVNASMGLIVAAPTAGSCGVVPGVLLALRDERGFSDEQILGALWNAGAIGYLAMRNATVAGAVGGCQAEVGVAAAMAASAATELMEGSPAACLDAASIVLMNMLGLVCDPVGGLVEYPCQNRNAAGAANALAAAEIALCGIPQLIPFDQMLDTMYKVGRNLPAELRETALGGCAVTPAALHCAQCAR